MADENKNPSPVEANPMLSQFQSILVDQIQPSSHQARKKFDIEAIRALSESMRQEGLLQPITVREVSAFPLNGSSSQSQGGIFEHFDLSSCRYELVSGERRLRAAKMLAWERIDARVIQTISEAEAAAKGMVENLQRVDLDPIEEAEGLAELNRLDPVYWTQQKIADVTGKSQGEISKTLRLLDLPETIKNDIRQRILTREHGTELLRVQSVELQHRVVEKIKQGLTVKKTRELIDNILQHKPASNKSRRSPRDPFASEWEKVLSSPKISAAGAWGVSYRNKKWNFNVNSSAISSKKELAQWFHEVAEAIHADD